MCIFPQYTPVWLNIQVQFILEQLVGTSDVAAQLTDDTICQNVDHCFFQWNVQLMSEKYPQDPNKC